MTIRVNTGVEGHSYDQAGATFSVDASGNLTISVPEGTVAIYAVGEWSHVTDQSFTAPAVAAGAPPTAGAAPSAPANAAPPAPTPVVTEEPVIPANPAPAAPTPPAEAVDETPPANPAPPVPEPDVPVDSPSANPAPPPPA